MLPTLMLVALAAITISYMLWSLTLDEYDAYNRQKLAQLQGSVDNCALTVASFACWWTRSVRAATYR